MNIGRIVITGAAALALVAGGTVAGAAIASGPVDGSGVIHGCFFPADHAGSSRVVLQNVGTSCPDGATAITWNQTGPQGATGPQGLAGPQGATGPQGPPGSNAVYGRIIGVDFGSDFGYNGAPSGVSTASTGGDLLSEELSATSALVLQNLQVQLVQPGSDTADPIPLVPGAGSTGIFDTVQIEFQDQGGNIGGCVVGATSASTCSLSTIGTIPAGSLLRLRLDLITNNVPPPFQGLQFLLPGYTPDVVFSYQATAAS